MPHFEVHTLADDRWLIDSVFFDKTAAIDDAKLLIERSRAFDAVRVLQVEEADTGFNEWTVFAASRPGRGFARQSRPAETPKAAADAAPAAATAPRRRRRAPTSLPALLLLSSLAVAGTLVLFAHRPAQPTWVWVFDRPEAWQHHDLRNPWSGEVSK